MNSEEHKELRLRTIIPFLRKVAEARNDKAAILLFDTQTELTLVGADEDASLIAGLVTARLEDEEGYQEAIRWLDAFFLNRTEIVMAKLLGRMPPGLTPEEFLKSKVDAIADWMRDQPPAASG